MQTSLSLPQFGEIIFLLKHDYQPGGFVIIVYSCKEVFTKPPQIRFIFNLMEKLGKTSLCF